MIKLNIHSIVDVITNSSTVIYTYQNNTTEAKELLQEILKLIGDGQNVDDVFCVGTFLEDDIYEDRLEDLINDEEMECPVGFPTNNYKKAKEYITSIKEKVIIGKIDKPEWMTQIEKDDEDNYDTFPNSTYLHIIPKEKKYEELAKKMLKFLNAVDCDGGRDG